MIKHFPDGTYRHMPPPRVALWRVYVDWPTRELAKECLGEYEAHAKFFRATQDQAIWPEIEKKELYPDCDKGGRIQLICRESDVEMAGYCLLNMLYTQRMETREKMENEMRFLETLYRKHYRDQPQL